MTLPTVVSAMRFHSGLSFSKRSRTSAPESSHISVK